MVKRNKQERDIRNVYNSLINNDLFYRIFFLGMLRDEEQEEGLEFC